MKNRDRHSLYEKFFFSSLIFVSFLTILGLFYVHVNVEYISFSYKYMELKREYKELIRENERLNYEVERLSSPSRIERYARVKLGMIYPEKTVYIDIYPAKVEVASSLGGKYVASP